MSKRVFHISYTFNEPMRAYDVCLLVGGIQTKDEMEELTKALAEFMAGDTGTMQRVGFDA